MKPAINFFVFAFLALALPGTALAMPLDLVTNNFQDLKASPMVTKLSDSLKLANTEAFCSALGETKNKLEVAVKDKEAAVSDYLGEVGQNLEDERNARDAKLGEARSVADQARSEWQRELEARAENDAEEAAVSDYQKAVEAAVDKRRDGVDLAIVDFRKSVDALLLKRSTGMQSARDSFKTAVETATKKLESDCKNGVKTETLLKDFKAALKAGRDKLAADKKAALALQAEMKTLAESRKKSIASAVSGFRSDMQQANEDLEASFAGGE